jgi:hypothetical protein
LNHQQQNSLKSLKRAIFSYRVKKFQRLSVMLSGCNLSSENQCTLKFNPDTGDRDQLSTELILYYQESVKFLLNAHEMCDGIMGSLMQLREVGSKLAKADRKELQLDILK